MGLHKEHEDQTFNDLNIDNDASDLIRRKKVKKILEEKLERKRLREEFMDDFDELSGEFDWDELDK